MGIAPSNSVLSEQFSPPALKKSIFLKLTENITRTNKKHWLRYLDPNKNDMDAREKYVPNVIGYTESDAKYTVKGTPYIYNPYCIFDTPKCK